MKEQLIAKFKSNNLLCTVEYIVCVGYEKTGNKFSIMFNGSKGYLNDIEIFCEGTQKDGINIIYIDSIRNQKGLPVNKMISIYHSKENGVRIVIGENKTGAPVKN